MMKTATTKIAVKRKRHSSLLPQLCLCGRLRCLAKLYHCDAACGGGLCKNHKAQRLRINHVYGEVHTTAFNQLGNDLNLQKADDGEVTAHAHVHNDDKLYQPRALRM